jgi:hypothetical protein
VTTIIKDPLVADHICELELASDHDCDVARQRYEEGNLVLLRGQRFDLDFAFLNRLNFDVEGPPEIMRKLKKYGGEKIVSLDPASPSALDQFVVRTIFGADEGKLAFFQQQVKSGDAQSDALYGRIFGKYEMTRRVYTWRFTSTMFENLHWDNFGIPERFHQVRIFTNIATAPRLWRTSHRIDHYAASIYRERDLAQFSDRSGDHLVYYINNSVLGGMKASCIDRLPKHHIAFEQGDVWLCETRIVSHQIYHGQKAFAAMYFSDPATMERPELGFDARIARLHEQQRGAPESQAPFAAE